MDTDTFIKSLKPDVAKENARRAVLGFSTPNPGLDLKPEKEETYIISNETPSGILVEYSPSPRRFYRVQGQEVPSVTTVLDCLEKGGLPWWGMKVGVQGVIDLFERGKLATFMDFINEKERVGIIGEKWAAGVEDVVNLLKQEKLTVNHVRDAAGDRGTNVHDALEQWAKSGGEFFPTPQNFPETERGYVEGLLAWIDDLKPTPVMWETMVGTYEEDGFYSAQGYAGRYDLVVTCDPAQEVVVKTYPKKADVKQRVECLRPMVDLKTSKGVYPNTHFRQLQAYETASLICGYEPTDAQFVLRVTADGKYEFVRSTAVAGDFDEVLSVWYGNQRLK